MSTKIRNSILNLSEGGLLSSYWTPQDLIDGNTVTWYDPNSLLVKDTNARVSVWGDKTGSGHDFLQSVDSSKPFSTNNGILCPGDHEHMQTLTFPLVQPTYIYMAVFVRSWVSGDCLIDGFTPECGMIYQNSTPNGIKGFAGASSDQNDNLELFKWSIVRFFINGANSKLQVNETPAIIGNFGSGNMNGITLANYGTTGAFVCADVKYGDILVRKISDSIENETKIYNYFKNKYLNRTNIVMNLVIEGHSFVQPAAALETYINKRTDSPTKYTSAVGGSLISDVSARSAVVDSKLVLETTTLKNLLVLYIGVNDVGETVGQGTTAYNSLKIYIQERVTAGWIVTAWTMLPSVFERGAIFESERNIFNTLMKNDLALINNVYILDTDTLTELNDPMSAIYYDEAHLHPTSIASLLLSNLYVSKLEELF